MLGSSIDLEDCYCRLYIETELNVYNVRRLIADFMGLSVDGEYIISNDYLIRYNQSEDSKPELINTIDGFLYYKQTAWLELLNDDPKRINKKLIDEFIIAVCNLINYLRNEGIKVVSAGGFDDVIADRTGWNWTEKTPIHP